jgi:tRNA-2-methylthio-N6-dimethylallyladenosine synthase
MLLGQNVNSYRAAGTSFAGLLRKVGGVGGILRVRFMTSHPKDFPDELLAAMAEVPQVCPHLHLPLQSGSDRILALMNRGYTLAQYRSLIERLRGAIPGLAVTTDLIAGFPGETEEEFEETARALEEFRFDDAFIFKYSDREGTRAMALGPKVPGDEIVRRHAVLLRTQERINAEKNAGLVGSSLEVFVEGFSPRDPGRLFGRTGTNRRAAFRGSPDLIGRLVCVTIRAATALTLLGDADGTCGGDHA